MMISSRDKSLNRLCSPNRYLDRTLTTMYRHLIIMLFLAGIQAGCGGLPKLDDRAATNSFRSPQQTSLGKQLGEDNCHHTDTSGILLLDSGQDAFRYRIALVRAAERAIDLQYFIWNDDRSGNYMAARLLEAAGRGVRVRLLLDDFHAVGSDAILPALNTHPNIEVRAYNPFPKRKGAGRWMALLADFKRLNRRMHNKSLVVDGAAAIIGGRNIGDEYFDLSEDMAFLDRELLVAGPVVVEIGQGFDAYWNSEWSYPLESLIEQPPSTDDLKALPDMLRARDQPDIPVPEDQGQSYTLIRSAANGFIHAPAELVVDRVPEVNGGSDRPKEVAMSLAALIQEAREDILIESAYLVIGEPGDSLFEHAVNSGVRVRTLTNSLNSNDVLPNHAAYVRRRQAMLRTGMELHELMAHPEACAELSDGAPICETGGKLGLHTKSVVFDGSVSFIGSFNLNKRSVFINTEMGLLVHSPELAKQIAVAASPKFEPENSWRVTLDERGRPEWTGYRDGRQVHYSGEPASFFPSLGASLLSLFPATQYF